MAYSLLKTTFDAFQGIVGSTNTDFIPTKLTHIEIDAAHIYERVLEARPGSVHWGTLADKHPDRHRHGFAFGKKKVDQHCRHSRNV